MAKEFDSYFAVDRIGLRKVALRHGASWVATELLQNALDEDVTRVDIIFEPVPNKPLARLCVQDDSPDGFRDLDHAYTLFAESYKKSDPTKRGRFNLGEKLVLAICESASISTTTGTVEFGSDGHRVVSTRRKRARGSVFESVLHLTREQFQEAERAVRMSLIPAGVVVTYNGERLEPRVPVHTFSATLDTEIATEDGFLRKSQRQTNVRVFEIKDGESATLYEMGLPVVATDDKWHVDIGQKVPLTVDRSNVPAGFLRAVRAFLFNEMNQLVNQDEANDDWVRQATSDRRCSNVATSRALDLRFGEKRVSFDPSDLEANYRAVAEGYTVIHGRQMSRTEWENARNANAVLPAGKVFPTPKPYSDDPNAPPEKLIPRDRWTPGMHLVANYAGALAQRLLHVDIRVEIAVDSSFQAAYGHKRLVIDQCACNGQVFDHGITEDVDALLLHEFGHHYEGNHLSEQYHCALTKLGAAIKHLALNEPEFFAEFKAPKCQEPVPAARRGDSDWI